MSSAPRGYDAGDRVLVHASAVIADGAALLFPGPSGAGKSTICRLLSDLAQQLADDTVFLIRQEQKGWVVDNAQGQLSPASGSERKQAAVRGVPLRGIFYLYQAGEPHLEPVGPLETCRYLVANSAWWRDGDVENNKKTFANLAAVARSVPGYRLYFNLLPDSVEMMRQVLLSQARD